MIALGRALGERLGPMSFAYEVRPTRNEYAVLERWANDPSEYRGLQARVLLHAAREREITNEALALVFGLDRHTVGKWRYRFATMGLAGLGRITNPPSPPTDIS